MLTMCNVKKSTYIKNREKNQKSVKAIFDSVNALAVYNTVQCGINQDHRYHNLDCYLQFIKVSY